MQQHSFLLASVFLVIGISGVFSDLTLIKLKKTGAMMDYEAELVTGEESRKRQWQWQGSDEFRTLNTARKPGNFEYLLPETQSCTNNSKLMVDSNAKKGPWTLWTVTMDGKAGSNRYVIKSQCGNEFRLRAVGNWVKLIQDDPCKVTEDDIFIFKSPAPTKGFVMF